MVQQSKLSRRGFLKAGAVAGGVGFLPLLVSGKVLGLDGGVSPSNKVNLGAIGINGRGSHDFNCFIRRDDIRFRAICDIRRDRREAIKNAADNQNQETDCAMYRDMEELLIRDDIDAVLIATGDRWHTMASIIAARMASPRASVAPSLVSVTA